ncbi:MAG: chromosomal replication initiator protein DnaA [Candidatus Dormibacteraeota bacterium]|uniref:Chromosomal replication initiator protein DnaA n=1 Tax=Candidatus Dormiibacter inghamiae TaxID=3127013 RepID=A0A934K6L3_9BACT|nr:chromosomal replication initiator protein DnaA [Candidatus Dormibacteraeota bacterium]MBJ7605709.1 chromosomal replication initiator protein DnaA [Candidatus Dormibacteraeota bacterium]
MNEEQIWSVVQDDLRFQIPKSTYETWVRNTVLLSSVGSIFQIGVPSRLHKSWLEDRFAGMIRETLQEVVGSEVQLDFVVSRNGHALQAAPEPTYFSPPTSQEQPATPTTALSAKFRFATFVVGNNSRFAHAAAQAVAEAPGLSYNPLFLYGGVGLGKTHLMHAIGHHVQARWPQKRVVYLTSEHFMNEMITSIQANLMEEFRTRYRTVDVLLIDDIQFLAGNKATTKEEFFHTFNALHEIGKQVVISSDRAPKDIPTLEDRLRSRFEQGLMADIQPPDFETRVAILRAKVGDNDKLLSEEVLTFIAHKVQKNIRELEGALTRLLAYSAIHQKRIGEAEAAELLADIIPAGLRRPLSIDRIQQVVAGYYELSVEDMKGKRRDKHIVLPRQVAMYLVREETPSSLPQIGQAFGGRDHTTALHSIDKIANEIKEDARLRYDVQAIRDRLDDHR